MSPSAVDQNDIANLPLSLNGKGKQAGVEDIKMEAFEKTELVLGTFRCLIADLCHQFGCGHPGYVFFFFSREM
jgi:dihydroxyacetone synthase